MSRIVVLPEEENAPRKVSLPAERKASVVSLRPPPAETPAEPEASATAAPAPPGTRSSKKDKKEEKPKKEKKKRLTKAERKARRLQAAIDFKKLELRTTLNKELELTKANAKKAISEWEDMCKEIKMIEMREEVEEWQRRAQYLIEQKDEKIESLIEDIESTQEMHSRNFSKQMEIMDFVINSYNTFLENMKTMHESQSSDMVQKFYNNLKEHLQSSEAINLNKENIMHAENLIIEKIMNSDYQIYLQRRDDIVNEEIEQRYMLRDDVVKRMREMHQKLNEFIEQMTNTSLDTHKYQRIAYLMERQRFFYREMERLNKLEQKQNRIYSDLAREWLHLEIEAKKKLSNLRLEYQYFLRVRKNIEALMTENRAHTFEKLRVLTSESYKVMKHFRKLEKYGELLLVLAANCRKLQTEEEKVARIDAKYVEKMNSYGINPELEPFKIDALCLTAHMDLSEDELLNEINTTQFFWRRQALVEGECAVLEVEKAKLLEENRNYIEIIKSLAKADKAEELLALLNVNLILPSHLECP